MNELVELITQKTGLSPEMAQKVVTVVAGYIETKLPAPLASALASHLGVDAPAASADGAEGGLADKAKSMVAGLFGNKDA